MPTGTKVNEVYQALLKKGYSKEKAARIAQSQTGEALATGRPPKHAVTAANEQPEPLSEDLTTPSSERTTEAQAAATAPADAPRRPIRRNAISSDWSASATPQRMPRPRPTMPLPEKHRKRSLGT